MSLDDREDMLPRNVPKPAPFIEETARPTVPEVSLLFEKEAPNRSFSKGGHKISMQQKKLDTNVNTTPVEPYNTWRLKYLSHQNSDGIANRTNNTNIPGKPFKFESRSVSNSRKDHQQSQSHWQQQILDLPSRVEKKSHCNYQTIPPEQYHSKHTSYGKDNACDHSNNVHSQVDNYHNCFNIPNGTNDPEHYFLKQRIHSNGDEYIPNKNFHETREPKRFSGNCIGQNFHVNESNLRSERVFIPAAAYEDDKYCHERDFKFNEFQDLRMSSTTSRFGWPHHMCTANGHTCGNRGTTHCISKETGCSSNVIPCATVLDSHKIKCDPCNCTQTENQNFIRDMMNIIQAQNVQILKFQEQIKQLIKLHINCHKIKDKVDVSCQFDSPNMNLEKLRRSKRTSSENLAVIKEHSGPNVAMFQNENSNIPDRNVTVGVKPVHLESSKVNSPKNCCCDYKKLSPTNVENSPRTNSPHIECSNRNNPNLQSSCRPADLANISEGNVALDKSFTLNEADLAIGTIAEQAPSPASSVHVDMQEYNSSSYEESDSTESSSSSGQEDSSEAQVGWTFYNKVLGQVNNILNKHGNSSKPPPDSFDAVRNATIEHFKKLGISFTDIDNTLSKKVTFDAKHSPQCDLEERNETDVTMHFNALAMHYLKDDVGLKYPDKMQDFLMYNVASGNTNLSFATLRYLERYHLLPTNQDQVFQQASSLKESHLQKKKKPNKKKSKDDPTWYKPRKPTTKNSAASKILDISTLKQQPKLL